MNTAIAIKDVKFENVELSLGELLEMENSLDVFDRIIRDGKHTLAFALLLSDLNAHIKAFYTARTAVVNEFSITNNDGQQIIPDKKVPKVNEYISRLLEDVIIVSVPVVTIDDLAQNVSALKLSKCLPLFKYLYTE